VSRLRDGAVQARIAQHGAAVRSSLNEVIADRGVAARVYGLGSHIHFLLRAWPFADGDAVPPIGRHAELAPDPEQHRLFRLAMLLNGVDVDFGNNVSTVHGEGEAEALRRAFAGALDLMREDGLISTA